MKTPLLSLWLVLAAFWGLAQAAPARPPDPGEMLSQEAAVAAALQRSPALQALLAEGAATQARVQASARPALFRLSLARLTQGDEREIDRGLSLNLLELITWPWRAQAAQAQVGVLEQAQALAVLSHAQAVRAQWVQAVAAQQRARYLADVAQAARLGATLARRLQASGQFSAAQADQEALVQVQAELVQAQAEQQALADREALIRLTGLPADGSWQLPERLPEVPATLPLTADQVAARAVHERLDTRLAEARWQAVARTGRDEVLRSVADVELGWQRQTSQTQASKQGPEVALGLLASDLGAARRRGVRADEQAALAQWEQSVRLAQSQLRERWAAYVSSHRLSTQASERLVPLRQRLLDERLKQYNGMLIGPLTLLDEARAHTHSVIAAMDAQRDHWLNDIALRAALEGSEAPAVPRAAP